MVLYANDLYHTKGLSIITDSQYDLLREYIQEKYPDNTAILQVGAPIRAKDKVRLPYNMPSMDKIKPDSASLSTWASKYIGPYVISCKLDGVSGMYSTEDSTPKLYTRGDGSVGQDISHLIKALRLPNHKGYVVRGEFIITKSIFKDKYSDSFSNARNLVAGFVNSKTLDKTVHDVHFVCYEVIKSPNGQIKPSDQMRTIEDIGHEIVQNKMVDSWSKDTLSDLLLEWRSTSDYEMDGIIVSDDNIYPRSAKNPSHAFAFKMALDEQTTTTQVVDVIWKTSQDGYLKPRVRVVPVNIGGVTIEYATGFNGKFIEENKIGPGAEVKLIRSGDVIPYIQSVISQAPGGAKMPDVKYKWNPTHVDIIVVDIESNIDVKEKNIIGFFTDLETESLSAGNLRRIIDAGYDSIPAIIHMSVADLLNIDGFKEKMAEKIHSSIETALKKASLTEIMTASNKFGRGMGFKIISGLMEKNPDFLISTSPRQVKLQQLNDSGIHKGAETFLEGIEPFKVFLADCDLSYKLEPVKKEVKPIAVHPLNGKAVVMSGIRDKEITEFLTTVGATLEESMKANVVALIVKDTSKETAKTKEAIKKNIPIITVGEFREQYMYKSEPENKEVNTILAQSLNGKAIVMSGIRDKEIAEFLTTVGATLEESMKPNVVALIVKDTSKETAKTKEAIKKNIPIITVEDFKKQYM
jgi:NAD-dependent DNA ligase